jgi:hypothetical protein
VRRLVGYDRLELPALPALEYIHHLAGDYINFLHPVRKLVSKTRSGPRVSRRYDIARTPFHRLLDSGVLSITKTKQLQARSKQLDPLRLKAQLEAAQRTLCRSRASVGFLREATVSRRSDPKLGHHGVLGTPNRAAFPVLLPFSCQMLPSFLWKRDGSASGVSPPELATIAFAQESGSLLTAWNQRHQGSDRRCL